MSDSAFHRRADSLMFALCLAVALLGNWQLLTGRVTGDLPPIALAKKPQVGSTYTADSARWRPSTEDHTDAAALAAILGVVGPYYGIVFVHFMLLSFGMLPVYHPWRAGDNTMLHQACRWVNAGDSSIASSRKNFRPWQRQSGVPLSGLANYNSRMRGTLRFLCILAFALSTDYMAISIAVAVIKDRLGR